MKRINIWKVLFLAIMALYIFKLLEQRAPEIAIDPSWKYVGAMKVHDDLYQHEFLDSLGQVNIIFRTTPEIHLTIKQP